MELSALTLGHQNSTIQHSFKAIWHRLSVATLPPAGGWCWCSVNQRREEEKSQAAHNAANNEDNKQESDYEDISVTNKSDHQYANNLGIVPK